MKWCCPSVPRFATLSLSWFFSTIPQPLSLPLCFSAGLLSFLNFILSFLLLSLYFILFIWLSFLNSFSFQLLINSSTFIVYSYITLSNNGFTNLLSRPFNCLKLNYSLKTQPCEEQTNLNDAYQLFFLFPFFVPFFFSLLLLIWSKSVSSAGSRNLLAIL